MTRARRVRTGALLTAGSVLAFGAANGPRAFDTGELVAAAFVLGGSHPPGQPLHAIVGYAATLIPLGPAAFRVSLVSSLFALIAAALAGALALRVTTGLRKEPLSPPVAATLPFAVAFAVLVAPPVLRQATRPEVYTLALALFAAASLALVDWAMSNRGKSGSLLAGAFAAGLVASLHPPHGLAALGVGAALTLGARRDLLRRPRVLLSAAAACLFGMAVLAYLPLRAAAGAPTWGNPTTLSGFFDYVSGAAYQHNLGSGAGSFGDQLLGIARYLPYAAGIVPFIGLYALSRGARDGSSSHRGRVAGVVGAAVIAAAGALVIPLDPEIPDTVAYAGPAVLLVVACGAAGIALVPSVRWAMVGLGGIAVSFFALEAAPAAVRADAPVLDALALDLVHTPPSRSLVIVTEDFSAGAWTMERAVADARPDVALFISGLGTSSWHWQTLAAHPAFDGTPVAGPGRDARERYTHGAISLGAPLVPVAVETDDWTGGHGALAGPYMVGGQAFQRARVEGAVGERLAEHIAWLAREGPPGDADVVHRIYRAYEVRRARRLALRQLTPAATEALARALIDPAPREEAALATATQVIDPRRLAPVVREPGFGVSRGDVVREAAALLAACGASESALDLLESHRPADPRTILQAAHIALANGHPEVAAAALREFEAAAPDLSDEARSLRVRLGQ